MSLPTERLKAPVSAGWAALLVAVVAAGLYAPSLLNGFAYDDVAVVAGDPRVQTMDLGAIVARGYWGDDDLGIYRPVTTLSFAIDWSLGFGRPAWFHLTNALLHAGASALVLLLLLRWLAPAAALAGGLVFALHPVHVEAVANVVGRAEMLSTLGVLGALLLWTGDADRRSHLPAVFGIAALFTLALGSKENAVVLIPLLALVDFAAGRLSIDRPVAWLRANAVPLATLLAVCVAWFAIRAAVLGGGLAPGRVDAAFDVATTGPARILTALQAWPVWAGLLFAPVTLLADYGPRILMPIDRPNTLALIGGILAAALTIGGIVAAFRGRRQTALGLLWFPITILPVSNLLFATGVIVAERTLYLPSLATSLAIGCISAHLLARPDAKLAGIRVVRVAFVALLVTFGTRSMVRIPVWASTESVFAALAADRPDSFRAHWTLARQARTAGQPLLARRHYDVAVTLWPFRYRLVLEAAMYAGETGDLERARELARHAVSLRPDDVDSVRYLAGVALDLHDTGTAEAAIRTGLDLAPADDTLLRMRAALNGAVENMQ